MADVDLRIKKTHLYLTKALFKLLEEKSFDNIKVSEICDLAMVHKTTFYNHFDDKYDLLKYAIMELQKNMLEKLDKSDSLLDYYLNLARQYIKHISTNRNFYCAIIYNDQNSLCLNIFYNLFINEIEDKLKNEKLNVPINYISNYYLSGVFQVVNEWLKTGMKEPEDELIIYIKKLLTNGF